MKQNKKHKSFFLTIFVGAVYIALMYGPPVDLNVACVLREKEPKQTNVVSGVFFGVITMPNDKKQEFAYEQWMRDLKKYYPSYDCAFICGEGQEIEGVKYLHYTKEERAIVDIPLPRPRDRDISIKRYIAAKYFLEHTNLSWFWSTSDDCIINLNNLGRIVKELDFVYDTEDDIVYQGHCIRVGKNIYLQGGSGYIFSRKAVKIFLENAIEFIKKIQIEDDIAFLQVRKMFNLTIYETASPYMVGHIVRNAEVQPSCPRFVYPNECYGSNLIPVKYLTGIHYTDVVEGLLRFKKILENQKKYGNLHYYYTRGTAYLCRKEHDITYQ